MRCEHDELATTDENQRAQQAALRQRLSLHSVGLCPFKCLRG
jgi:hypothetical protein